MHRRGACGIAQPKLTKFEAFRGGVNILATVLLYESTSQSRQPSPDPRVDHMHPNDLTLLHPAHALPHLTMIIQKVQYTHHRPD